jgi:hypothetical protein
MDTSQSLRAVVFESANPDFYLAHFDLILVEFAATAVASRTEALPFLVKNMLVLASVRFFTFSSASSAMLRGRPPPLESRPPRSSTRAKPVTTRSCKRPVLVPGGTSEPQWHWPRQSLRRGVSSSSFKQMCHEEP